MAVQHNTPRCPKCGSKGMYYQKKKGQFYCRTCNTMTLYSNVIWTDKSYNPDDPLLCLSKARRYQKEATAKYNECLNNARAAGFTEEEIVAATEEEALTNAAD